MSTSLKQAIEAAKSRVEIVYEYLRGLGATTPQVRNISNINACIRSIPVIGQKLRPTSISFSNSTNRYETLRVRDWFDLSLVSSLSNCFRKVNIYEVDLTDCGISSKLTNMNASFSDNYSTYTLNRVNMRNLYTNNVTNFGYLFNTCTRLNWVDMSNCNFGKITSATDAKYYFYNCTSLRTIIGDSSVDDVRSGSVLALVGMKGSLPMSACPLNFASMLAICKGVGTASSSMTITFKSSAYNALTDDEKAELDTAIAGKNFVIATA